jgi:NADH:ubiquinone oxidoreductase subunit 6 (subunit J)
MNAVLAIIAVLTLAGASVALSLRNLIHSALLLIASWFGIAAFYLWAGAEFVAFAQVLVYVGAVSMVVLFAVLLTRRSRADLVITPESRGRAASGVFAGATVAAVLASAVIGSAPQPAQAAARPGPALTVRRLGEILMGPQAAAVLVVGVILTVALIGAVVIAAGARRAGPGDEP